VDFLVDGITYSAQAENLSERGVFVATEMEVFDGLEAHVSLYLDDASDPIKIVGSVARLARRRDERPGFAVEFGSLDETTRARILSALPTD
jgi:Tfp pilus assembly protein PilZ